MNRNFLGIDIGGTASRWAVVSETGKTLARGSVGGATGHLFNPAERARFAATIAAIHDAAGGGIAGVYAGVTGLGAAVEQESRTLIGEIFGLSPEAVLATDDVALAFRATFAPGAGHLVAAGTGSIGIHFSADGQLVRVGGRGILVDDGGSGAWIALRAIDRLFRRIDAAGEPAEARILADKLFEAIGGEGWEAVRSFVYGSDRGRIGMLATPVAQAAELGDPLATAILYDAIDELTRLARALIFRGGQLPVAFIGGVIDLSPMMRPGLQRALPDTEVLFPTTDAALAAAHIARTSHSAGPDF
ncbi:MAG TPA: BadF/BadG/BcrA/BcrD ATPase family protein, partial [Devosia sp.]|nr:BadF/BadG/BcrA/BcrD ATPase family protein [Devosia sp.]